MMSVSDLLAHGCAGGRVVAGRRFAARESGE